ncbi:MAG TPA: lysyl oxidase family protein, partial [Actinomycetota bacterium]|nr:lysyl oxidase family protein [Actinomycetota bacterium]
ERVAGEYEFHKTHAHFHNRDMAIIRLLKLSYDGDQPVLEEVELGGKMGYCLADNMVSEYRSSDDTVDSDPQYLRFSSCDVAGEGTMYLNRGWIDVYGWHTPGNYVEFGDNDEGEYVVQFEVDAADMIKETNERDNVAYTWLTVDGNDIVILERGRGESPWDHQKEIVDSSFHSAVSYAV